jgi:four helix bundle protein
MCARDVALGVYRITNEGPIARDFALRDQMRRAAISVISNIAEGFERRGDNELRNFLSIAKGSLGELRAQLLVAQDLGLVSEADHNELRALVVRATHLVGGLIRYIEKSQEKEVAAKSALNQRMGPARRANSARPTTRDA